MRLGTLLFLLLPPTLFAQAPQTTPAPAVPLYDVVTIKPNNSVSNSSGTDSDASTFQATNVTIKRLLERAFDIRPDLISGIPATLESRHYDINAKILDPDLKALEKLTRDQRRTQILAILTDRFHLQAHIETRTLALFDLTLLSGPLKFTKAEVKPDGTADHGTDIHNHSLTAKGLTLAEFAATLTNQLHRAVRDTTGLPGLYDFTLKWSPDDADPTTNPDPPFPTALEEQLGLKLKPSKGPVPTLVIDHLDPPTDN